MAAHPPFPAPRPRPYYGQQQQRPRPDHRHLRRRCECPLPGSHLHHRHRRYRHPGLRQPTRAAYCRQELRQFTAVPMKMLNLNKVFYDELPVQFFTRLILILVRRLICVNRFFFFLLETNSSRLFSLILLLTWGRTAILRQKCHQCSQTMNFGRKFLKCSACQLVCHTECQASITAGCNSRAPMSPVRCLKRMAWINRK